MESKASQVSPDGTSDAASLLGRIALAALFLWSGYGKLAHMAPNIEYMKAYGLPAPELLIWPAALLELIAGLMLVLGWKVRWAAVALAAYSIVAALIFHNFWAVPADQALNQTIHFMKNVAMVGGLLFVYAHGSGQYAIERS